jgi:hypothetical protein
MKYLFELNIFSFIDCITHATIRQLMTNVMLPRGILNEFKIDQIYYQNFNLNHLYFRVFDSYMWANNFVPCGNIYDFWKI